MAVPNSIRRVGIVDDDDIFTALAGHQLKTLFPEAEIRISNDPLVIEQWYFNVDVLFLDINMVETSAWDFIDAHGEKLTDVYLLLCSSSVDKNDMSRARTIDVIDGYVIKPITPERVDGALNGIWPEEL